MATNFPGPYGVEIFYSIDGFEHKHEVNCAVQGVVSAGDAPNTINIVKRDGSVLTLADAVDQYTTSMQGRFSNQVGIDRYDFWEYAPLTFTRKFITSGVISKTGSGTNAYRPAGQDTYTFRTQEGGIMRLVYLETPTAGNGVSRLAGLGTGETTFVNSIVATDNWILARDTSYPVAFLKKSNGENEAVWRKRFR